MSNMQLTSNIAFLYFEDFPAARTFFEVVLGLKPAYDPGWSCTYQLLGKSYLGAVDASQGSIEVKHRGGVLISLTVDNLDEMHQNVTKHGYSPTPIKRVKELPLESFFFVGPEGYQFEFQHFTTPELQAIF